MKRILFVCLGNICRSPTAHAVLRQLAVQQGLELEVESAGTSASHKGEPPDPRSVRVGSAAGYDFSALRSRPVQDGDFAYYDLILAMDKQNLRELASRCPAPYQHKLRLMLSFHPEYPRYQEVPDPYYGGSKGFELVLRLLEESCQQLLQQLPALAEPEGQLAR